MGKNAELFVAICSVSMYINYIWHYIYNYPAKFILKESPEIMQCEKLEKCPFYQQKMPMDSGLGAIYRQNYCESNKEKCARYLVAAKLGAQNVPVDLYPNMQLRAEEIINSYQR
ncbi:MAG: hypothetical protein EOM66_01450 [Clostridia bacterium]|nr:hypothetical protein [Clostridia bacterium]